MADRRYTYEMCECGNPDCAGCNPEPEREYFAYRHISGHIYVKRYSAASLNDAEESDFVDACTGRYVARDRAHAEEIAKSYLSRIAPDEHLDDTPAKRITSVQWFDTTSHNPEKWGWQDVDKGEQE